MKKNISKLPFPSNLSSLIPHATQHTLKEDKKTKLMRTNQVKQPSMTISFKRKSQKLRKENKNETQTYKLSQGSEYPSRQYLFQTQHPGTRERRHEHETQTHSSSQTKRNPHHDNTRSHATLRSTGRITKIETYQAKRSEGAKRNTQKHRTQDQTKLLELTNQGKRSETPCVTTSLRYTTFRNAWSGRNTKKHISGPDGSDRRQVAGICIVQVCRESLRYFHFSSLLLTWQQLPSEPPSASCDGKSMCARSLRKEQGKPTVMGLYFQLFWVFLFFAVYFFFFFSWFSSFSSYSFLFRFYFFYFYIYLYSFFFFIFLSPSNLFQLIFSS